MTIKNHYFLLGSLGALIALGGCFGVRSAVPVTFDVNMVAATTNIMPIVVIGSGPAGLMAALYGARGGKDTFVFEGNKPGGLLMDTTEVENWPGEIKITGQQIMEKLRAQAMHHGVRIIDDAVERIDTTQWPYKIYTENGHTIHALTIIIATGASPRRLYVPGEERYWGFGVTSCAVCDAPFFRGQNVVVVGGGDSAIEEAIQLASFASKITILVRKGSMRAAASMQDRLKAYDKISIVYNVEVIEVMGNDTKVTGVKLKNHATGATELMPTDGVFLAIGHDPNTSFLKGVVATDAAGYIQVKDRTQATTVAGIFAAGDVEDFRYRQAGSAAGSGINAGLDAVRFLDDHGYTPTMAAQLQSQLYGATTRKRTTPATTAVIELSSGEQFNELSKKGTVFVDFWSETCPSCKQMLPHFEAVAQEYRQQATFITVDIDQVPDIVEKLFVRKVPCLLVFRDGDLIARYTNAMDKKELTAFVGQFMDTADSK